MNNIIQQLTSGQPSTGLHQDIPFEIYQQIRLPNSSAIGWGMVSMKHMRACVAGELEDNDTKDRKFGRATHCILLEPDSLETRFKVGLPCQAKLASGQRKGEACGSPSKMQADDSGWYCGVHCKGKLPHETTGQFEIVSPEEDLRLHRLRDSLRGHVINKILHRSGWSEVSAIWEYDAGLSKTLLKGRIDRLANDCSLILDIKKCQVGSGSRYDVEQSITSYGWHRQAQLYRNAVHTLRGCWPMFAWVVVEDGPPYDVQFIPADDETLAIGQRECERVLGLWQTACETKQYTGYITDPTNVMPGGLTEWYRRQFNDRQLTDRQLTERAVA